MISAALYVRVSTDRQEELSPDAQKRLLLEYAKKNNFFVENENVFIELGISGKKADKRPEFQRMIASAKNKQFDVILVWKYSRFARNQEESIVYKSMLKNKCNVDVISISEPLVEGPFGGLIERIIEWMDEYYSIRLAGEVTRGMTEKAMRGGYQAHAPVGYLNVAEKKTLIIDEPKAEMIRMIYDKYLNTDMSMFAIARMLNDLGYKTKRGKLYENRTVKYILQNPVYKGYSRWSPGRNDFRDPKLDQSDVYIVKGNYEPIVSEETFEKVQAKINAAYRPTKARPTETQSHWLVGVLKCSNCGANLVSSGKNGFQCAGYSKGKCKVSHNISTKKMEKAVLDAFLDIKSLSTIEYTRKPSKRDSLDQNIITNAISKIKERESRLKDLYLDGIEAKEEYKSNKEILVSERMKLENKLTELQTEDTITNNDAEMKQRVSEVYDIILDSKRSKEEKSNAVKLVCDKIIFNKPTQNIEVYLIYT